MIRFAAAFAALFLAQSANAGQWEKLAGDNYADCQFRYTGQIMPGDLTGYIPELANGPTVVAKICLDSPGGSLSEVYRFLKRINQGEDSVTVATRVESGAVCESSCAILFMFGQAYGANSPYPMREVEPGARLGFHSPFIAPGQAQKADAADAFRVALDVSKLLTDSSYTALTSAGPALPPELVGLVLGTPGEQMRHVETVGELKLLGIEMVSDPEYDTILPNSKSVVTETIKRICASSYVISNRTHFVSEGYEFGDISKAAEKVRVSETKLHHLTLKKENGSQRIVAMTSGPYYVPGWYSAGAVLFCQVEMGVEKVGEDFKVGWYNVGFGGPQFDWDTRLATEAEIERRGMSIGLVPIDTRY